MKASIIVPVWNHCDDLTVPFVKDILENTHHIEFELIIVNNGSKDGTAKFLKTITDPRVTVITVKDNIGFGPANNVGYRKAKGDYICFTSNDVQIIDPEWLNIMVAEVDKGKRFVGQEIIDFNTLTTFQHQIIPYLAGYVMTGSREMFEEIKEEDMIFDEAFGPAYFEDVELSYRATLHGYTLSKVKPIVNHLGSKTTVDQMNIPETTKKARVHYTNKMLMHYLEKTGKKRIVFYYKESYPFTDDDYMGKGVGGSEAALILLSRELAKKGYLVEIYNNTKVTGTFNGVHYHNVAEFRLTDYCDVFILFRAPYPLIRYVNAQTKLFWSCDQYTSGLWRSDVFPYVDKIITISPYHEKYIQAAYGPTDKTYTIDLGVNVEEYKDQEKVPGKLIYCSVPRRGLNNLLTLFPEIKKRVPHATLVITSDYRLWGQESGLNEEFIRAFSEMPGVTFLGKIPRSELVTHQKSAEIMAYPCDYEECFCISALECIAAGAVPVTSDIGALKTTVAEAGIVLSNTPGYPEYDIKFVESVVTLLTNKEKINELRLNAIKHIKSHDWSVIAGTWEELITNLQKSDKTMVTCTTCGKSMQNSYVLSKHVGKYHGDKIDITSAEVKEVETKQKLKFKQHVECNINGEHYEGREMLVPYEMVDSVLITIRGRWGNDILDL